MKRYTSEALKLLLAYPLQLRNRTMPVNLSGIKEEELVLSFSDGVTFRRGTGKFRMVDPFDGRVVYVPSDEDLSYTGEYMIYVGRDKNRYILE